LDTIFRYTIKPDYIIRARILSEINTDVKLKINAHEKQSPEGEYTANKINYHIC